MDLIIWIAFFSVLSLGLAIGTLFGYWIGKMDQIKIPPQPTSLPVSPESTTVSPALSLVLEKDVCWTCHGTKRACAHSISKGRKVHHIADCGTMQECPDCKET